MKRYLSFLGQAGQARWFNVPFLFRAHQYRQRLLDLESLPRAVETEHAAAASGRLSTEQNNSMQDSPKQVNVKYPLQGIF